MRKKHSSSAAERLDASVTSADQADVRIQPVWFRIFAAVGGLALIGLSIILLTLMLHKLKRPHPLKQSPPTNRPSS